jgi:hypothetical protein
MATGDMGRLELFRHFKNELVRRLVGFVFDRKREKYLKKHLTYLSRTKLRHWFSSINVMFEKRKTTYSCLVELNKTIVEITLIEHPACFGVEKWTLRDLILCPNPGGLDMTRSRHPSLDSSTKDILTVSKVRS